jgi:hypothetical protein
MRRPSSRPKHNPIALGDQVIDRVVRIWKCVAKPPFKPLELGPIHRGGAHVTDVVGSDELIEAAGKASVREANPPANQFLISVTVREWHRQSRAVLNIQFDSIGFVGHALLFPVLDLF